MQFKARYDCVFIPEIQRTLNRKKFVIERKLDKHYSRCNRSLKKRNVPSGLSQKDEEEMLDKTFQKNEDITTPMFNNKRTGIRDRNMEE